MKTEIRNRFNVIAMGQSTQELRYLNALFDPKSPVLTSQKTDTIFY